ncbi:MAG TPA: siphovirus Gp157 family protein, partial [Candidatus Hydrogenedentes bacterium]|nr:siphovirus Gp157 family protein [Candidatus Hydrogenedentota bacterium]
MSYEPLYKIASAYAEAAARLAETDLDDQTIADTLEGLAGDLRDKAIAVASVIRNMEADAKAIREAICDMESRLTRIETRTVGLREYLLTTLQATNIRKVECPWFAVSVKKNSPRVVIDDESLLPTEMMTIKP